MTVQESISLAQELLMEEADTPGALAPRGWMYFLRTGLNEVCQAADGFYYACEMDLTNGQAVYCAPPLYKIVGCQVLDANGQRTALGEATARDLRMWIDPNADTTQTAGTPAVYVTQGANQVTLYPTPGYSTVGTAGPPPSGYGLLMEGYAKAGDLWIIAPSALTDLATECPVVSENAQMAAVLRACILRCRQFPSDMNLRRLPGLEKDYAYKKGLWESETATKTSVNRQRMSDHVQPGTVLGSGFDPLGRW